MNNIIDLSNDKLKYDSASICTKSNLAFEKYGYFCYKVKQLVTEKCGSIIFTTEAREYAEKSKSLYSRFLHIVDEPRKTTKKNKPCIQQLIRQSRDLTLSIPLELGKFNLDRCNHKARNYFSVTQFDFKNPGDFLCPETESIIRYTSLGSETLSFNMQVYERNDPQKNLYVCRHLVIGYLNKELVPSKTPNDIRYFEETPFFNGFKPKSPSIFCKHKQKIVYFKTRYDELEYYYQQSTLCFSDFKISIKDLFELIDINADIPGSNDFIKNIQQAISQLQQQGYTNTAKLNYTEISDKILQYSPQDSEWEINMLNDFIISKYYTDGIKIPNCRNNNKIEHCTKNNFSNMLFAICTRLIQTKDCLEYRFVMTTSNHVMGLVIKQKTKEGILKIEFFDPNKTQITKSFYLSSAEEAKKITILDLITENNFDRYMLEQYKYQEFKSFYTISLYLYNKV